MRLKQFIFAIIFTISVSSVYGQWTTTGSNTTTNNNIGLGINPTSKLHINGDLKMNIGEGFRLYGDQNYFGQYLDALIFEMHDTNAANGSTDGGFLFRGYTPKDGISKDWMVIKTGGKVGIGTTTPSQKLDIVTDNGGVNYLMHIGGKTHLSGNAFGIGFNPEGRHNVYGNRIKTAIVVEGNNTGWSRGNLHILQNNNQDMTAATLEDSVFTVSSGGNVGIGTTDPKNELSVNGTIWGKKIRIKLTDAADWVFEDDYNLRPLTEVENYIKTHRHLPEIPSAEEFRANDMEVSEMTNKLLQKIEELTLYTIEQEKELEAQNKELEKLENEVDEVKELKARLAKLEALLSK